MRSRKSAFAWLVEKEWRDLVVSRSWWVLLIVMGPLVGVSFSSAIRTYAEVSGLSGTAADATEVLSPLIGVWAPTFSACELAAVFLLPFLAIHLVAGDRQSGALKLELQQGISPFFRIAAKSIVALAAWLIAMLPPLSAFLLWRFYGGSIYAPEMAVLIAGHLLNAGLTIALGAATASLTEHPSTAAILTLAVTVSTWIINFFGAIQGGLWERAAGYTPAAMVGEFQHGLVRLDSTLVALALILTGLGLAAIWMRLGVAVNRRVYESAVAVVLLIVTIFVCTMIPASQSWDWSESRGNSFSEADEAALRQIHTPLRIEVHLAPEDPRRVDLERRALSKLRRVMPNLQVNYESSTSSGLFEQTSAGYGEVRYYLEGRSTVSRVTTAEGVLEAVYSLARVAAPKEDEEAVFRGRPVSIPARSAVGIFYVLWPALFLAGGILLRKRLK